MPFFECKEENIGEVYGYRQEIERELLGSMSGKRKGGKEDCKMIRIVSKALRLSLLEANVLCWLLQRSQGLSSEGQVQLPGVCLFEGREDNSYFLELLLNGYYVKSYLASRALRQIEADIEILLPNFSNFYSAWRPCVPLSQLRVQELNKPFECWSQLAISGVKDYNAAVDKILQLSKSYNIGGKGKEHPEKSSLEGMQQVNSQQPRLSFDMESYLSLQRSDYHFSSGKREQIELANKQKTFRPFGESSRRGEIGDVNWESIFDSKNILEPIRPDNPLMPLSNQKKNEEKPIKHTFSFMEDLQE